MRYVNMDNVEPGQYLGRTIFSGNGTVLLSEGVQLTVFMINTLRRIGATSIYIKDPQFEDIEIPEIISDETKRQVIRQMVDTMDAIRSGKPFLTKQMSVTVDLLLEDIMRNRDMLVQLNDIRTEDNQMYMHAMQVAMMSVLMGISLHLNAVQLKDLAIGALLHDIGKVGAPDNHEGRDAEALPEQVRMRLHHTWRGFEILKNKKEYNLLIAHVAFQHHEAPDGTGVPRGLEGDQIHLYAKIVAVANCYDHLLNEGVNGKTMLPHEACEYMLALSGTKLGHDVLVEFMRMVSVYPTGSSVRLSTKESGVVVGQHRGLPGRPVVRVLKRDEDDIEVKEIDLAVQTTLFIDSVLS